jgi:hypothetical protein
MRLALMAVLLGVSGCGSNNGGTGGSVGHTAVAAIRVPVACTIFPVSEAVALTGVSNLSPLDVIAPSPTNVVAGSQIRAGRFAPVIGTHSLCTYKAGPIGALIEIVAAPGVLSSDLLDDIPDELTEFLPDYQPPAGGVPHVSGIGEDAILEMGMHSAGLGFVEGDGYCVLWANSETRPPGAIAADLEGFARRVATEL